MTGGHSKSAVEIVQFDIDCCHGFVQAGVGQMVMLRHHPTWSFRVYWFKTGLLNTFLHDLETF